MKMVHDHDLETKSGSETAILLCTSALQVVGTRAILEYEKNTDQNLQVIIIHPTIGRQAKKLISQVCEELAVGAPIDLTEFSSKLTTLQKCYSRKGVISKFLRKSEEIKLFRSIVLETQQVLHSKCESITTVFLRRFYTEAELIFLEAIEGDIRCQFVEDGDADYLIRFWWLRSGSGYLIRRVLAERSRQFASIAFNWFQLGDFASAMRKSMICRYPCSMNYSNSPREGAVELGNEFLNNISQLSLPTINLEEVKVVIAGVLMLHDTFMSLQDEIDFYNRLAEFITKCEKVDAKEIWYKPHPRLPLAAWSEKQRLLKCSIFRPQQNFLLESFLSSSSISALYSIGSTSLRYASQLFGIRAVLVTPSNNNLHPLLKRYHKLFLSNTPLIEQIKI